MLSYYSVLERTAHRKVALVLLELLYVIRFLFAGDTRGPNVKDGSLIDLRLWRWVLHDDWPMTNGCQSRNVEAIGLLLEI
jgi:hypothetical protein